MKVNYYEILGLDRTANEQQIRDRFRQLARENHPDRYRGADKSEAERKFQMLTEALNILTNADKRRAHDNELLSGAPKATTDPAQIAKVYMSKGTKAFQEGDIRTAIENFDMAAKHNPADAKAHYALARAASRVPTLMRQAVQAAEAAVQRDPMNAQYLKEAGLICKRANLPSKAERFLEEALKWDKENSEIKAA